MRLLIIRYRIRQRVIFRPTPSDPTTGAGGDALTQNLWYDPSGNVMLNQDMQGAGSAQPSYDGISRATAVYAACNETAQTYATAGTVSADTVAQQRVNTW